MVYIARVLRLSSLLILCFSLSWVGCGDDDTPVDAAPPDAGDDAGMDAGDDAGGPVCEMSCGVGERCCDVGGGAPQCVDVANDDNNCGVCGRVCSEGRGTHCEFGQCVCGRASQGCSGDGVHLCCPPRTDDTENYCANLQQDAADCGACGTECDPAQANACEGGQCRCGDMRGMCDGTPTSTCCDPPVGDTGCYDLTTSLLTCGACDNPCQSGERCDGGICTLGETSCEGCVAGQICCDGVCCGRDACGADGCMGGA